MYSGNYADQAKELGSSPKGLNLTVDGTSKLSGYVRKWMTGYRIRLTYVIAQLIPPL
jgi:hypothetical protein